MFGSSKADPDLSFGPKFCLHFAVSVSERFFKFSQCFFVFQHGVKRFTGAQEIVHDRFFKPKFFLLKTGLFFLKLTQRLARGVFIKLRGFQKVLREEFSIRFCL